MFTVLATGSRDYTARDTVWDALDEQLLDALTYRGADFIVVHVGDCPTGADHHAREWVFQRTAGGYPVRCEIFYAAWAGTGRAAGPIRNQRMVEAGADVALAFYAPPPARNIGTAGCARLARAAGIKVVEHGHDPRPIQMELPLCP